MTLAAGTKLGPYEILSSLGAGGMGEVYRAKDTRLGRDVALKVLPADFLEDKERRSRFEREARALAALNHPNIAAIYAFEEIPGSPGGHLLVMELVEGESLDVKIARGALPLEESLSVARQMAEALEAAHGNGIVHRDLKPANVKVSPKGQVKLLDFGLAKALDRSRPTEDTGAGMTQSATLTAGATAAGMVLGTPAYMSPEQARGAPVDGRTDVWALGCVLYELLTGRRAFAGESVADTLASVLRSEPDYASLPQGTPTRLVSLLPRTLQKDSRQRVHDIGEVRRELETILTTTEPPVQAPRRLVQLTSAEGVEEFPAFWPDGERIVFSRDERGLRRLVRLEIGSGEEEALTAGGFDEIQPDVSPDGRTLFFVRAREPGKRLEPTDVFGAYESGDVWALDLETRRERRLAENAFNPSASPDGARLAFDASWVGPRRLWTADARGRNPEQASRDDSEAVVHVRPRWAPNGRHLVFQSIERTKFDVRLVDLESKQLRAITDDLFLDVQPTWDPSGTALVFSSQRSGGLNLWRLPVDASGSPSGRLQQLTTGAGQDLGADISPDGRRLAFGVLRQNAELWRLPVDPASGRPSGAPEKVVAGTRESSRGCPSPDGSLVAFSSDRSGEMNIWLFDSGTRSVRPVTRGPGGEYQPRFSPDGSRLVFFSCREGPPDVWRVNLDGSGLTRLTLNGAINVNPVYAPDGRQIAYMSDLGGRLEVWLMGEDGEGARPLTDVGVMGHFLLFSQEGGHLLFRCPSSPPRTLRVSVAGGEAEPVGDVRGGAHMSFSPDRSRVADVVAHKTLWISPLAEGMPEEVFAFEDPDVRIDYPFWTPDGGSILFDRVRPRGGDIWMLETA
jgi:Tol biopolymer transport system component